MGRYSRFDPADNVIYTDASNVAGATREDIDEIFDELLALARARVSPVFVIACWKNASFSDQAVADYYGKRTAELAKYVRGVMRYGADDPVTRAYIRAQTLKHLRDGVRSNLFETRAEALEAARNATSETLRAAKPGTKR